MTIKEELQNIKEMVSLLIEQRSSAAIDGLEGDNKIIDRGLRSLNRVEELIDELDPEGER